MRTPRVASPRRLALGVAVVVVAFALGAFAGLRAPWGTKHPQVKQGVAVLASSDNDLVLFEAEDGTQLTLHADSLWWESGRAGGEGDPPCLREPGKEADVEVGVLRIAGPGGGWRSTGQWVRCL